jgi:hypothetical protein
VNVPGDTVLPEVAARCLWEHGAEIGTLYHGSKSTICQVDIRNPPETKGFVWLAVSTSRVLN